MAARVDEIPASRRARLSPDERRAQLIALGVAALAEHPLGELNIERLAADAGVSRALLFHYFGSRHGFQRELVKTARDSMLLATEPDQSLAPLPRLTDTLRRTVGFVRAHGGTFFSLVRGPASGDPQIREVVEQARVLQTERVVVLFRELGVEPSSKLRIGLRGWLAFTEQALVDAALADELGDDEIVELLEHALRGIASEIAPEASRVLFEA
ncbi:TetR/AcrR family transcriptional regulator [Agromyces sp. H3Y2-19a]|uniref:TetR/AcrR family transcriptional regulator n=1 Tax=Agromyces TaxID=33877 RepID=UPI001E46084E|nr:MULTISPECIES: TetR/AcrR family transcriptional regulator [Agromyces]MCD5346535.1 TetR/AcrR family transcriptional regulator [Agromyces sp. S2-1-8]MDF0512895.1 TetR/AcrR family transcriptional regulator [Agromyces chromiiresistens]